jgi:hypothetical protein
VHPFHQRSKFWSGVPRSKPGKAQAAAQTEGPIAEDYWLVEDHDRARNSGFADNSPAITSRIPKATASGVQEQPVAFGDLGGEPDAASRKGHTSFG